MTICDKIRQGRFVVTSEIGPPKGTEITSMLADADLFKGRIDGLNITDQQSAMMRLGPLAASKLLKDRGHEVIYQITCRDRNRIALQSDLLSAAAFGIENVVALTGDYTSFGDHPEAKPVFDLDSVELLEAIKKLGQGTDMMGNPLKGSPRFCVGAVVNPGADPLEPEIIKMEKKIEAGAQFFQTQAIYDIELFKKFLDGIKHLNAAILGGVMLLKSAKMARYMNENVAGIFVPESFIREMEEAPDKGQKSVEIAVRLIKALRPLCQGIHLMPIGWDRLVPKVLDAAGL